MGTRNLTCVQLGGEIRVAQYAQWDGYPSGQGQTIADFLRDPKTNLDLFKQQVAKCYFLTREQLEAVYKPYSDNGMMNMEQVDRFKASEWGYLSRDTGADILAVIRDNPADKLGLKNSIDFAKDGLFCEWAYVVNLDTNELEIYKGFKESPPTTQERFCGPDSKPAEKDSSYYPVQLWKQLKFSELPRDMGELEKEEEEANA
jgi:hypothetical protein